MNTRRSFTRAVVVAATVALAGVVTARPSAAQYSGELPAAPGEAYGEEVEALLHGPVHEAFAKPIDAEAEAAFIAPEEPPAPIEEIPPEVMPEGEDVLWLPGYWSWDAVEEDYLWVSGVWRSAPPDMRWVPGYWMDVSSGWQWISGFWTPLETEQVEYLPPPPESLEQGPTSPAPSQEYFWVTGCWIYRDGAYAWRPGYWAPYYENWVWVPAHYVWTPSGAVFCDGYWDYPLARRGQLFAPVYFRDYAYRRPAFTYTPRVVLNVGRLLLHMFVNPGYRHYYFGDYYHDRYRNIGYYPWSNYYASTRRYDPMFSYYRTYYQVRGVDYAQRLGGWHTYFARHENYRPPRTFNAQAQFASRFRDDGAIQYALLGQSLRDVVQNPRGGVRFERLDENRRRSLAGTSTELRDLIRERSRIEAEAAARAEARGRDRGDDRRGPIARFDLPDSARWAARRERDDDRTRGFRPDGERRDDDRRDDRRGAPPRPDRGPEDGRRPDMGPDGERRGPGERRSDEAGRPDRPGRPFGDDDRQPGIRQPGAVPGQPGERRPGEAEDRPGRPGRPFGDDDRQPGARQPGAIPGQPGERRPGETEDRPGRPGRPFGDDDRQPGAVPGKPAERGPGEAADRPVRPGRPFGDDDARRPGAVPGQPDQRRPDDAGDRPGRPDRPSGEAAKQRGARQPGLAPGQPSAVPGQPSAVPSQPQRRPDDAGDRQGRPDRPSGDADRQPGARQPGLVPGQPSAIPGQPSAVPGQPQRRPDDAGDRLERPGRPSGDDAPQPGGFPPGLIPGQSGERRGEGSAERFGRRQLPFGGDERRGGQVPGRTESPRQPEIDRTPQTRSPRELPFRATPQPEARPQQRSPFGAGGPVPESRDSRGRSESPIPSFGGGRPDRGDGGRPQATPQPQQRGPIFGGGRPDRGDGGRPQATPQPQQRGPSFGGGRPDRGDGGRPQATPQPQQRGPSVSSPGRGSEAGQSRGRSENRGGGNQGRGRGRDKD
jgi:hypothetical protein